MENAVIQDQLNALAIRLAELPLAKRSLPSAYSADDRRRLDSLAYAWTDATGLYLLLIDRAAAYDKAYGPSPASDWQTLADFETLLRGARRVEKPVPPMPQQRQMALF